MPSEHRSQTDLQAHKLVLFVCTRSTLSSEHFQADSGQLPKPHTEATACDFLANVTSLDSMICNCTMLLRSYALAQIVKLVSKKMATKKD